MILILKTIFNMRMVDAQTQNCVRNFVFARHPQCRIPLLSNLYKGAFAMSKESKCCKNYKSGKAWKKCPLR
jgi:hypothetical protein